MSAPRPLLRVLNVHSYEWWMVKRLFLLQFFQGAGIAFFTTSAYSLFLKKYDINTLPTELAYVFIFSAFLLWGAGYAYAKVEKRYSILPLSKILTLFMGCSILLFRISYGVVSSDVYFFAVLGWTTVLYLLNNLEFWGVASLLFDVRQSKRLFGVISAGDIPAKMIGFLAAFALVKLIGSENLMWGGAISMFFSLIYLNQIERSGQMQELVHTHHEQPGHLTDRLSRLLKNFSGNTLIRRIATLSVIISISFIIINYSFYTEVKKRFDDNKKLAQFIPLFLAVVSIGALFVKLAFTSRLLNKLGLIKALLITPIITIGLSIVLLASDYFTTTHRFILYIFGATVLSIDIFRIAINTPIFLTLMQPLDTHERLRAHTIVKGIMDPIAFLITGSFLLFLIRFQHTISITTISYLLLLLGFLWIFGVYRINQEYLKTLIKTIGSRYFGQEEFNIDNKSTQELLKQKVESGNELEVLYILKMLSTRESEQARELIAKSLHHPSLKVINEALNLVSVQKITDAIPKIKQLIQNHPDHETRASAIRVLAKIGFDELLISSYLNYPDRSVQQAAVSSLLGYANTGLHDEARQRLFEWLTSPDPKDRKTAVDLISELPISEFDDRLPVLLEDPERDIQLAAIKAIGRRNNESILPSLFSKFRGNEKQVTETLVQAGNLSLPYIKDHIADKKTTIKQKELLIYICARIGGAEAHKTLLELLKKFPHHSAAIIKALYRAHFKSTHNDQLLFEHITQEYLAYSAEILHMQKRLDPNSEKYSLLFNSLQLELVETREVLLCLFSFLYDREKMIKVKYALQMKKKEVHANAFELVDMTVKKDFANPFATVFEQGDLEHRCNALKNIFPKDIFPQVENIITKILTEDKFAYNNWTMACSLYTSKKFVHRIEKNLVRKYVSSDDQLLKETAEYAS